MTLRKRMPTALLGAALITLALSALGGGSGPNFGDPLPGLTGDQQARFLAGKLDFEDDETPSDGLGPVFNDTSCVNCHSTAATGGGSSTTETRFGRFFNGLFDPMTEFGGSLIQSQGIGLFNGVDFVGEVVPRQATIVAKRRTTPLFGLGLVDNVPDQTLIELAQQNGGRANMVTFADPTTGLLTNATKVGRFGWKCQQATLFTFSGDAYLNEMGITTPMFPDENCPQGNCALLAANPGPAPTNDSDNSTLVKFTDFMTFLGAPPPGQVTAATQSGAHTFAAIGCANCHVPALQTGPNLIAALDNVTFFPFSDFLLHDMGSLGDGIAQAGAGPSEMRTAPLWGVRVLTRFLHDGRANSLAQAILAHDGQGKAARNLFAGLQEKDKDNLISFLKSL